MIKAWKCRLFVTEEEFHALIAAGLRRSSRYNGPSPCVPNASTLSIASETNVHRAAMEKTAQDRQNIGNRPAFADERRLELAIEY